jgi:hypothetical protein
MAHKMRSKVIEEDISVGDYPFGSHKIHGVLKSLFYSPAKVKRMKFKAKIWWEE